MVVVYHDSNTYLLRFDRGEEVLAGLRTFCADENIGGGSLSAIGAAASVSLQFYDIEKKDYETQQLANETFEIASLTGNIARDDQEVIVHAHGVFSTTAGVHAGHIKELVVGATAEVTLHVFQHTVYREYSEEIGLKLLKKT